MFCVHPGYLDGAVALGIIYAADYESVFNASLHAYLDTEV